MIGFNMSPDRRADFGPVTLVFADKAPLVVPGQPMAKLYKEEFKTNLDALQDAANRLGNPSFDNPWISSTIDQIFLWGESQMLEFARDPLVFAATVAGIFEGDLSRGPVDLHGDPRPGAVQSYPTLRNAIIAAIRPITRLPFSSRCQALRHR